MTSVQRVIKYFAIALAICLIINIFSGIYLAIYHLGSIFTSSYSSNGELKEQVFETTEVSALDIELLPLNL